MSPGKIATKNLTLNIKVGPTSKAKFIIHKGEQVNRAINKFAIKYKLDKDSERLLRKLLEKKIANRLKE